MSREEAIESLRNFADHAYPNEEFLMAIKALEREPILDKIRAEIARKANSGQWSEATIYGMQKSIAIIDKYRQEG